MKTKLLFILLLSAISCVNNKTGDSNLTSLNAEDGYRLWLRYDLIDNSDVLGHYRKSITGYMISGDSPTLKVVENELQMALAGLLGQQVPSVQALKKGTIVAGTPGNSSLIASLGLDDRLNKLKNDGYLIMNTKYKGRKIIVITSNSDVGVLYGTFHFLRHMQMHKSFTDLSVMSSSGVNVRILNHWDVIPRKEGGPAGNTIWQ